MAHTPLDFFRLRGDEVLLAAIALHEVNFADRQEAQRDLRRRLRKAVQKRMPEEYEKHLASYEREDRAEELEDDAKRIRAGD